VSVIFEKLETLMPSTLLCVLFLYSRLPMNGIAISLVITEEAKKN
jgi:hypothetical protein